MSLVRFGARNHPQQIAMRGANPDVDERATSPELFAELDARFGFSIDVCALERNAKCERFYSPAEDGLAQSWRDERVWCNPPFSDIEPWVVKAAISCAELVVMLVPANRTEQGWWQRHVEPVRDRQGGLKVEFLAGRTRFIRSGAEKVGVNERPPFGCALLVWGEL